MLEDIMYEFDEEMFPNAFEIELEEHGYVDEVLTLIGSKDLPFGEVSAIKMHCLIPPPGKELVQVVFI